MDNIPYYYSSDPQQIIQPSELEHIHVALAKDKQSMLTERELTIYQYLLSTKVFLPIALLSVGFALQ